MSSFLKFIDKVLCEQAAPKLKPELKKYADMAYKKLDRKVAPKLSDYMIAIDEVAGHLEEDDKKEIAVYLKSIDDRAAKDIIKQTDRPFKMHGKS